MSDSTPPNKSKTVRQLDLGLATIVEPEGASSTSRGATTSTFASGPSGLGEDVLRAIKAVRLSPHLGGLELTPEVMQDQAPEQSGQQEFVGLLSQDKPEQPQSVRSDASQQATQHTEYQSLVKGSSWKELGLLCEGRMNSNPRDIEARLWWVKSQLAGSGVPVSMLTAPLDSASKELLDKGEAAVEMAPKLCADMSALAGALLIEMADLSMSKGDDLVALTLFERAYLLGADAKHKLFSAIKITRERIERGRKTPKEEQVLVRLAELEAALGPRGRFGDESKSKNKDLNSARLGGPASFSPRQVTASTTTHRSGATSRPRWWLALVLIFGLIGGVIFLFPEILGFSSKPVLAPIAMLEDSQGAKPRLPLVSSAAQPGNLDAILYEIDSHGQKTDKSANNGNVTDSQKSASGQGVEKNTDAKKDTNASTNVASPDVRDEPHETVNTTSPVEPPAIDDRSNKRRNSTSPKRPRPDRSDSVVEEFSPGRLYRIIVPTRAMAGPTLRGRALTELDVDDRIMVEARLGVWLKIRSKKGQIAYILAQDAHEAGD